MICFQMYVWLLRGIAMLLTLVSIFVFVFELLACRLFFFISSFLGQFLARCYFLCTVLPYGMINNVGWHRCAVDIGIYICIWTAGLSAFFLYLFFLVSIPGAGLFLVYSATVLYDPQPANLRQILLQPVVGFFLL